MSKGSGVKGKTVFQQARVIEAQERAAARAERTPAQQLKELDARPGASAKERKRLAREVQA